MSPYISQVACLMEQCNGDAAGGAALRALLDDFQAIGLGLGLGLATARVRVRVLERGLASFARKEGAPLLDGPCTLTLTRWSMRRGTRTCARSSPRHRHHRHGVGKVSDGRSTLRLVLQLYYNLLSFWGSLYTLLTVVACAPL